MLNPSPPLSIDWADVVDPLVAEKGGLAELVRSLYERAPRSMPEDPLTAERGIRRLRRRGNKPAEKYGQLLLRVFGLPPAVRDWARSLGTYHGPLIDLPMGMRVEQLRLWDRSPVLDAPEAAWIHLACASVAHHGGELEQADQRLELARLGLPRLGPDAQMEHGLFVARRCADRGDFDAARRELASLEDVLERVDDGGAYRARWLDQRAWLCTVGSARDLKRAWRLRSDIPADGPAFVRYRRHHGLAWLAKKAGRREQAISLAKRALSDAGDGGYLRLRVASLEFLARMEPDGPWARRAAEILEVLGGHGSRDRGAML